MYRSRYAGLTLVLVFGLAACAAAQQTDYRAALKLDAGGAGGMPRGWEGGPTRTITLDSTIVHSAPYSVRLERDSSSVGAASSVALTLPVTFAGGSLQLVGWIRTENVLGQAGLWLQEESGAGPVQMDYPYQHPAPATSDWHRVTLTLPLDPRARTVRLGAQVAGRGRLWMDDLELLVDGRPAWEAPVRTFVLAGAEKDHEFDLGSGVTVRALTKQQIESLVVLGKIWGFVKYHHPVVAHGDLSWDYELFRVLPSVMDARDAKARNAAIGRWLAKLGEPTKCSPCATLPAAGIQMPPDTGWIHDRRTLGADLSGRLERIYRNRFASGVQYYVGISPGAGQPDFSNEAPYPVPRYPDAGFRLLALYRYWNIIQYWFPYRYALDEDWTGVLREFVPKVAAAPDAEAYRLTMLQLAAQVHDTHANLWGELWLRPPAGPAQLPVVVRPVEGRMVVSGYADAALGPLTGLRAGDVIERLDGVPVDSLIARWRPYYAASNEAVVLRDVAATLSRGQPGPVRVTVRRGDETLELAPARVDANRIDRSLGSTHDLPGPAFRMLTDDVAYLKNPGVEPAQATEYLARAAAAKVLVIDLRNYPAFVVYVLGGHLVEKVAPFARIAQALQHNPGAFAWTHTTNLAPLPPRFAGKIVILVDEVTQSRAEFTTMALRAAPGAIVVGSTTAGADGDATQFPLPGGITAMITGNGIFYPDNRPTQRIGIVPDLVVRPTIAGIRDGRDEVLEAAVTRALGREFRLPKVPTE